MSTDDQVAQVHLADWARGRVTLVGDSCQAVSLLAGELHHADTVRAGLQRYQDRMKPVVLDYQQAERRAAEWFLPSSRRRLLLRPWALRLTDAGSTGGPTTWSGTPAESRERSAMHLSLRAQAHAVRPAGRPRRSSPWTGADVFFVTRAPHRGPARASGATADPDGPRG